ncbi:hypothetical protein ABEB36_004058 [Hypothenemus hampei]|uniref:DUF4817 domain-containing protein n=1 Tax=Hypothenemus hampei TaxID=57062 RepID=A0ABD1F232_HYPHA
MLTLDHKIYLIQCYGIGEVSYNYAIHKFNEKFPDIPVCVNTLRNLVHKFENTGSIQNVKKKKKPHDEDDAATLLAVDSVFREPKLSLGRRASQLNLSKSHLQRIFKENRIIPYKPSFIHELRNSDDAMRRVDFHYERKHFGVVSCLHERADMKVIVLEVTYHLNDVNDVNEMICWQIMI